VGGRKGPTLRDPGTGSTAYPCKQERQRIIRGITLSMSRARKPNQFLLRDKAKGRGRRTTHNLGASLRWTRSCDPRGTVVVSLFTLLHPPCNTLPTGWQALFAPFPPCPPPYPWAGSIGLVVIGRVAGRGPDVAAARDPRESVCAAGS
jgi:hypothetical protein